jgi:predicted transcriptional regulator of viral defense system
MCIECQDLIFMDLQFNTPKAGLSRREREIIDAMIMMGKPVVRSKDLESSLSISKERAILAISRLGKKGWLQKLKAGVFRIVPLGSDSSDPEAEDAMAIASEVFSPGYVGGWTAAEYWDLTEQIFNTTAFYTATIQRKKDHKIAGLSFKTRIIAQVNIFGTIKIWPNNNPIAISDMHRTMIDIMDDPAMGGGGRMMMDIAKAYWKKKDADMKILTQYALKLNRGAVFKRLGLIAEKVFKVPPDQLEMIKEKCKSGIVLLDPNGARTGPFVTKWGIQINIPIED